MYTILFTYVADYLNNFEIKLALKVFRITWKTESHWSSIYACLQENEYMDPYYREFTGVKLSWIEVVYIITISTVYELQQS